MHPSSNNYHRKQNPSKKKKKKKKKKGLGSARKKPGQTDTPIDLIYKIGGPSMIGVPHLNPKDSLQGYPNSLYSLLFHDLSYISPFFSMSNEIILFQIL
jgi:hypothetical protein